MRGVDLLFQVMMIEGLVAHQRALHICYNYLRLLSMIYLQLVSYSDVHSGVCACHRTAAYEG